MSGRKGVKEIQNQIASQFPARCVGGHGIVRGLCDFLIRSNDPLFRRWEGKGGRGLEGGRPVGVWVGGCGEGTND